MNLPATNRHLALDAVRAAEVISMSVAHVAPPPGPMAILGLSEFLTFPLFGLLVGAGSELGSRRRSYLAHLFGALIRGIALIVIGILLVRAGSQVLIVLVPLGVLTILLALVPRLPWPAWVGIGVVSAVVAPAVSAWAPGFAAADPAATWRGLMIHAVAHSRYPLAVLVLMASLGVLIARWVVPVDGSRTEGRTCLLAGLGLLGLSGVLSVAQTRGLITIHAYQTTPLEMVFIAVLASAVTLTVFGAARLLPRAVVQPLAWVGEMTLTLYVLQILWLAYYVHHIALGDDSWLNRFILIACSFVVAVAWGLLRLPRPLTRGAVEVLVTAVVDLGPAGRRAP